MSSKTITDIKNGALSSSLVAVITQPLQVLRTSMIVTYKDGKIVGMREMFKKIASEEGIKGFYRGFFPSMLKTVTGSAIYFSCLEHVKDILRKNHLDKNNFKSHTYKHNIINFCSAAIARTIQTTLVNPILIIKTRFEVVGCNNYNSTLDALIRIKREEGFSGYFKGLKQTLIKDVPHSACFFSFYEFFKYFYSHYIGITNLQLQVTLSTLSTNTILIFLTNPIDILRARIQYAHISRNSEHNYNGIISGIIKIGNDEGIRGLCAGVLPRFLKKGISSMLVWTTYETLKKNSEKKRKLLE